MRNTKITMFNIGLGELLVIAIVGIYVIKPQHLPAIAKIVLRRISGAKNFVEQLKSEFNSITQDSKSKDSHEP